MCDKLTRFRLQLEDQYRDPFLAARLRQNCREAIKRWKAQPERSPFTDLDTQIYTWELIEAGKANEVFQPVIDFLLYGFSKDRREPWGKQFQIGLVESLGIVPAIFKSEDGFVILLPSGFFEILDTFEGEIERLAGRGMYYSGAADEWPQQAVSHGIENIAGRLEETLVGSTCVIDPNEFALADLDRRNRVLNFVVAHEMIHAMRDHFRETIPFGTRMLERSADLHAFALCLRAEEYLTLAAFQSREDTVEKALRFSPIEKKRLLSYMEKGQEGYYDYMNYLVHEYVIACKLFYATAYLLEKTVGTSRLAEERMRTHPSPRNRAFFLSLTYGKLGWEFCRRRMGLFQRFALGRPIWRFAHMFLGSKQRYFRAVIDNNDRQGWGGRGEGIGLALRSFS